MKTILFPTDYSETANNALQYAVGLAKFMQAKIILFHAYHIPLPAADVPMPLISPHDLEKESVLRIKSLEKEISKKFPGEKMEYIVRAGFATDEIVSIAKERKIDLIVMGISGGGKVAQTLIGSNTITVLKNTQTPVLVIPKHAKFKEVEKITLAYNYNEPVNEEVMNRFKTFVKLFNAKVLVLDVEKPVAVPMYENAVAGEALENSLKDTEHTLFYSSAENITDGINAFVDEHKCDWLAMIPHKHTFLSGLFHKSNTRQMAFHTHIPLLSLHD